MKNLKLSLCALSLCAAAILLVGCGGAPLGGSADTTAQRLVSHQPSSGGTFSANYSGRWVAYCLYRHCSYKFRGHGTADFLGSSRERMSTVYGTARLKSLLYPQDTITFSLVGFPPQCPRSGSNGFSYSVTGGTGRFAHATGKGGVAINCGYGKYSDPRPDNGSYFHGKYTDVWSGTLYY